MPVPPCGYRSIVEMWWPVTPRLAVIGCWLDEPDDGPTIDGRDEHARRINATMVRAARRHWVHRPGTEPAVSEPAPPRQIAPDLYGLRMFTAQLSRRGREAMAMVEALIEVDGTPEIAQIVRVIRP